ncbi:MMPL family transporter [Streptomyces sp. N2-109]|uniref:MMPL family transporter n=1 Tax=Streptomyces gossypii TaxID=2883101 RepID=A0ABT2JYV5_9ACTN|nr:MMPL family transporter [Streptomyces gossypii]MCT2592848.1 MMPL family transporter [Streptomyces gossypii]
MRNAQTGSRARTGGNEGGPGIFERIAAFSFRHKWRALALWAGVLIGVQALSGVMGSDYHNDFSLPGTESHQALETMERHGAAQAGDSVQIVVQDEDGLRTSANEKRVGDMLGKVARLDGVSGVVSPYEDKAAISRDGTIGYATVTLDGQAEEVPKEDRVQLIDTAQEFDGDELRVELGGDAIRNAEESGGGGAEGAGILGALVILVFLFGSLVAASLPVITALFAVGSTMGLIVMASHFVTLADFTPPLMMLVGLGVGIDYALLIFSRYRSELLVEAAKDGTLTGTGGASGTGADSASGKAAGKAADGNRAGLERAARVALDAAGRTVFFAGCTVIIALLGMYALGLGSLQGVALAMALTVLITMIASLTLLPALLSAFGARIQRSVLKRARKQAARGGKEDGAAWRRWGSGVQRHPWAALLIAVVALGALASPALNMRLGFADAGNDAETTTSRQAYDLLADGFGPGFNGPLIVVADGADGEPVEDAAGTLRTALQDTSGIAAVSPAIPTKDPSAALVIAYPESAPQDEATSDLVKALREDVLPPVERETGTEFLVGGSTAAAEDFSSTVQDRIPVFVAIVVGLSALLLMAVFRSVLIPLKAALLNLLSIGASLGAITLVFQEGWFGAQPGPVESFIPVMIFAIVFGLSMDYEVFLLSRIHEEWERTKDPAHAVREGLAHTGKVITAAAAIMIVVFAAFILSPERMLQQFGLGLAVAILLDAVLIRCLIVPAVMQLLGRRAWWLPAPLARLLPRVEIEHHERPEHPAVPDPEQERGSDQYADGRG